MGKWVLLLYLIVLALFDWREQKIPVLLAGGGLMTAVAVNFYRIIHNVENWRWIVISIVLGMLPGIYMLAVAYFTGKAGYGDGITLLGVGMFTDYKTCILLWGFSMLVLSVVSVAMLCLHRANKDTRLPYLPFLTAVYVVGMVT